MRTDRATVLAVLRDPGMLPTLEAPSLDLALRQLRRLKLLGQIGELLEQRGLTAALAPRVVDQLQSARTVARARARLANWELSRLARVLNPSAERPVVVLKGGAYLLQGLPHAAGRFLSDVDLLVPEGQLASVEARLRAAGWEGATLNDHDERYYREWTHEIPPLRHVEREIEVDVHFNILQRMARFKPQASLLIQAARPAGAEGLSVLAPADMVLHAMTHLFYSSEQDDALRELVDIDALLRHFATSEPDFWGDLVDRAWKLDLARPASYGLRYTARWLGTSIPNEVTRALQPGAAPAPARWLMDRLLPAALFARRPDRPDRIATGMRLLLLARAHWIRMPPWLLVRHLANKSLRRIRGNSSVAT